MYAYTVVEKATCRNGNTCRFGGIPKYPERAARNRKHMTALLPPLTLPPIIPQRFALGEEGWVGNLILGNFTRNIYFKKIRHNFCADRPPPPRLPHPSTLHTNLFAPQIHPFGCLVLWGLRRDTCSDPNFGPNRSDRIVEPGGNLLVYLCPYTPEHTRYSEVPKPT